MKNASRHSLGAFSARLALAAALLFASGVGDALSADIGPGPSHEPDSARIARNGEEGGRGGGQEGGQDSQGDKEEEEQIGRGGKSREKRKPPAETKGEPRGRETPRERRFGEPIQGKTPPPAKSRQSVQPPPEVPRDRSVRPSERGPAPRRAPEVTRERSVEPSERGRGSRQAPEVTRDRSAGPSERGPAPRRAPEVTRERSVEPSERGRGSRRAPEVTRDRSAGPSERGPAPRRAPEVTRERQFGEPILGGSSGRRSTGLSPRRDGHRGWYPRSYGSHVKSLPRGYRRFRWHGDDYYHHGRYFYRGGPSGYVIVRPPIGAVILSLPLGFLTIRLGTNIFYCDDDIYYRRVATGYQVVEPPPQVVVVRDRILADSGYLSGDLVWVNAEELNVRSGPGLGFAVVDVVAEWETLEVLEYEPDWLYVRLPSGRMGWVMEIYVVPKEVGPKG